MSLFQQVPVNYLLTSGAGSALTWTNAVSVSSMNVSSLGASNLTVSTLTTSTSVTSASLAASTLTVSSITANSVGYSTLSGSTINATRLNYSSIVGSSISTNAMTLSLTNASTQNTQIYQVATTNPTTSYTAIQASHVSTGTTNNALVLNPSGGNVGVGTTAPAAGITLDVAGVIRGTVFTTQYVSVYAGNSTNTFTLTVPYPATYLFTVTGNGAYVGGGGDNYAKAIIYIHIGSTGVLLTTVVQAQGVGINSYTPGTQTLSYNIGTSGLALQYGGNSTVSITRLG